jgi:hypothetical protein
MASGQAAAKVATYEALVNEKLKVELQEVQDQRAPRADSFSTMLAASLAAFTVATVRCSPQAMGYMSVSHSGTRATDTARRRPSACSLPTATHARLLAHAASSCATM